MCKSDWGIGRLTIEPKKDKTVAHCSNVRTGSSIKEEEARENKAKKGNRRTTYTWRLGRTKGGETEELCVRIGGQKQFHPQEGEDTAAQPRPARPCRRL